MSWLDKLSSKTQQFQFGVAGTKPVSAKMPRDVILKAIDDSIAFFNNPNYRLISGPRKGEEPDLVYELNGEQASISLRYYRVRLKLHETNDELTIDKAHLLDALQAIRQGVVAGEFDAQIEKIKAARIKREKSKKPK